MEFGINEVKESPEKIVMKEKAEQEKAEGKSILLFVLLLKSILRRKLARQGFMFKDEKMGSEIPKLSFKLIS